MAEPVTETPEGFVPFAGMLIPTETHALLMAAIRREYPTVTADLDDDEAAQAVLISFMQSIVENDVAKQLSRELDAAVEQLRAGHQVKAEQGRARAQRALAAIQRPARPEQAGQGRVG